MPVGKVAENISEQQKQSPPVSANQSNATAKHLDTANGVRTSDLYESGHFEANSDLCGSDAGEHIRNYYLQIIRDKEMNLHLFFLI